MQCDSMPHPDAGRVGSIRKPREKSRLLISSSSIKNSSIQPLIIMLFSGPLKRTQWLKPLLRIDSLVMQRDRDGNVILSDG